MIKRIKEFCDNNHFFAVVGAVVIASIISFSIGQIVRFGPTKKLPVAERAINIVNNGYAEIRTYEIEKYYKSQMYCVERVCYDKKDVFYIEGTIFHKAILISSKFTEKQKETLSDAFVASFSRALDRRLEDL